MVGKGANQLDLFFSKGFYLQAAEKKATDDGILPEEGHGQKRAKSRKSLELGPGIFRILQHVVDMDHPALK